MNLARSMAAGATILRRVIEADARVVANVTVCPQHAALELSLPGFPDSVPGQFVQLRCADASADADRAVEWREDGFPSLVEYELGGHRPLLRRPFSIADRWSDTDGAVHLLILFRTVGAGTRWLEGRRADQTVNLIGPLGRGFVLPDRPGPIALVGGGIGIPPLLYLARCLHAAGRADVTVVVGATSRALLPVKLIAEPAVDGAASRCVELPGGATYPAIVTTDDGGAGLRGTVTDGLAAWARERRPRLTEGQRGVVFACGPEAMLRAVAAQTRRLGLDCQLSIERHMGCGLGTCLSCVVRRRDSGSRTGWRWALACQDGPVFDRDELLDYEGSSGA